MNRLDYLINQFGYPKVFKAGLSLLGYPGTWATTKIEINKIQQQLKQRRKEWLIN